MDRSTSSKAPPGFETCAARIVVLVEEIFFPSPPEFVLGGFGRVAVGLPDISCSPLLKLDFAKGCRCENCPCEFVPALSSSQSYQGTAEVPVPQATFDMRLELDA